MDDHLTAASADAVRGLIARTYLGESNRFRTLGDVQLREHQADAIRRLRDLLDHFGGALLADEVGLGKTYTALAVAAVYPRMLVVSPASLIPMWRQSAAKAGILHASFVSHEALSRRRRVTGDHDLLIVDEAHHARNPATHRYGELATLALAGRVLLISATPVHNSERDLRALFALFLGARAWTCDASELARAVVRREQRVIGAVGIPVSRPAVALPLAHNDEILEHIVALPPPVPPRDGGDGGALVLHGLVRQWSSSDAALMKALVRRKARALALIAALQEGRHPTAVELRSWTLSDDSIQLGFPSMLAQPACDTAELLESVRAHEQGVSALLRRVRSDAGADGGRASRLVELRRTHPGARIVAFTQFAETAHAMYHRLASGGGAAVLTARGAVVAGGRLSRAEALSRFNDPGARAADCIEVLLATDLLSEGIDLPEASVVVHLDLPWTPARLEQRVGRAVRIGSRQREVFVYHMEPPASASALLRVEELLRQKLGHAARTVGVAGAILPSLNSALLDSSAPTAAQEQVRATLARWLVAPFDDEILASPCVACVRSSQPAWLTLLSFDDEHTFLACVDGNVTDDAAVILKVLKRCEGGSVPVAPERVQQAVRDIDQWMQCRSGADAAGILKGSVAASGTRLLKRIGSIANRAPFHRRKAIATLASHARRAVLTPRGIGAERVMAELAASPLADDAWLRAVGAFMVANTAGATSRRPGVRVVAIMVAVPD